jgi:DNA-binding LacI/PurR family transcriptional regulator
MAIRLRDVAARAGVSVKTVSNVVNGYVHVAPETRARVQAVIDETGYRPNVAARNLRAGRAGVIALAVPELDNPYFAELTRFVVEAAEEIGWTVLVDQTDGLAEREREVARGFRHQLIDGLILSPAALGRDDLDERGADDLPLVLIGEKLKTGPHDHVGIDNVAAAQAATAHLLDLGRRRVAAIGHQPDSSEHSGVAHLRRRGWGVAHESAGLVAEDGLLGEVPSFRPEHGAAAMARLLDGGSRPDAAFCFNDTLALGVIRCLADRGVRVPEDIAVIGLDDVVEGRFAVPRLSTVAPDKRGIATTAVALLADRLTPGGKQREPRDVRVGFELVGRESTVGAAPEGAADGR